MPRQSKDTNLGV